MYSKKSGEPSPVPGLARREVFAHAVIVIAKPTPTPSSFSNAGEGRAFGRNGTRSGNSISIASTGATYRSRFSLTRKCAGSVITWGVRA
jgi:hypothetical protein